MHGEPFFDEEDYVKTSTYSAIAKIISSNISASILTFVSLLILSRVYSVNDYGLFTKYYYWLGIMYVLLDLGLPNALVISLSEKGKSFSIIDVFRKYHKYFIVAIIIVFFVAFYSFSPVIALSFIVCSIVGITLKLNSVKLQIVNDWGGSSRVIFYLPFLRSLGIFGVCFLIVFINEKLDANAIYLVMIVVSIVAMLLSFEKTKNISYAELDGAQDLTKMAWKLYIANIFAIVCMRADVIFISHFFNDAAAGEYARISMIFFAAPLLAGAINTVFIRGLSAQELDIDAVKNITHKLFLFTVIGLLLLLAVAYLSKAIIMEYCSANDIYIFVILTIAYAGTLVFGVWEAFINHRDQSFFLILKVSQLIFFIVTFLICYKTVGFIIGAIAFLASRLGGWILQWIYCNRRKYLFT
nr:O93 family O-antigen flippase [Escherichia coli]